MGITCTECRDQYAAAGRTDVPCDVGDCKYNPSPGDLGPKGCGLMHENEFVVWLYPKWKKFGEATFNLVDIKLTPEGAETLLEKLVMIEEYIPGIQEAQESRQRSAAPRKKKTGGYPKDRK